MTSERFIWLLLAVIGILLVLALVGGIYPKVVGIISGL